MYFDFTVPIPSDHVVRIRKDDIIYIYYEYDRKYNRDRGYNSAKRACIGKQSTTECNLMYPNQNFRKHFPEYEFPEEYSSVSRSCCLKIGTYLVIDRIVKSFEIPKMINTILGEKDGLLFLDFAAYSIITEGNAAQYYPDYAYEYSGAPEAPVRYPGKQESGRMGSIGPLMCGGAASTVTKGCASNDLHLCNY